MRTFINIVEAWHTTFKNDRGDDVEVLENPSRAEFMRLLASSRGGLARAWIWKNRLLVWDAYLSTHDVDFDLDPDLRNFDQGGYVHSLMLARDGVIINHPQYFGETPDAALEWCRIHLQNHPMLERIYGQGRVNFRIDDMDGPEFDGVRSGDDQLDILRRRLGESVERIFLLGQNVTVYRNPSEQQLLGLVSRSYDGEVRGLLDGRECVFWDGFQAVHYTMAKRLGMANMEERRLILSYRETTKGRLPVLTGGSFTDILACPPLCAALRSGTIQIFAGPWSQYPYRVYNLEELQSHVARVAAK